MSYDLKCVLMMDFAFTYICYFLLYLHLISSSLTFKDDHLVEFVPASRVLLRGNPDIIPQDSLNLGHRVAQFVSKS